MSHFTNDIYVITGGANGQGRFESSTLSKLGVKVVIADIDTVKGDLSSTTLPTKNLAFCGAATKKTNIRTK